MSDTLLIRADASIRRGTGHVMRCISLAQAWRSAGGAVLFVLAESTSATERRLQLEGFEFERISVPVGGSEDVVETVALARQNNASWVIADGYDFGDEFQRGVKECELRLLLFDDYGHAAHYCADVVVNQNLHAGTELYGSLQPSTQLLLGTRYVVLREQFNAWRNSHRPIGSVARKVLVTLGGADPDNITEKVVEALLGLDIEAKIVIGGSNPHFNRISSIVSPRHCVIRDAPNMPELMAWADVAISSGGTTVWELAFMGLPSIIGGIGHAERILVKSLAEIDFFEGLGWFPDLSVDQIALAVSHLMNDRQRRIAMSRKGRDLIDGNGCDRVIAALKCEAGTKR